MQIKDTLIPDVKIIEPKVFGDSRGEFSEVVRAGDFFDLSGGKTIVQVNQSVSSRGVLRGLHCQMKHPQGKLVRVVFGEVFDVAVDLRRNSPTFGKSVSVILSADNHSIFWIPEGFAHGFYVLSEKACMVYGCTDYYDPASEQTVMWNDGELDIAWPIMRNDRGEMIEPLVSAKDAGAVLFKNAAYF